MRRYSPESLASPDSIATAVRQVSREADERLAALEATRLWLSPTVRLETGTSVTPPTAPFDGRLRLAVPGRPLAAWVGHLEREDGRPLTAAPALEWRPAMLEDGTPAIEVRQLTGVTTQTAYLMVVVVVVGQSPGRAAWRPEASAGGVAAGGGS